MTKSSLTQAELIEYVKYDQITGVFTRNGSSTPLGTVNAGGYLVFRVLGHLHYAHRLAFLYMTGVWPDKADHMDGVRSNNKWGNLRNVCTVGNSHNNHVSTGAHFHKPSGRFKSAITVDGVARHLGYFDSAEKASAAYFAAKSVYHPNWVGATNA